MVKNVENTHSICLLTYFSMALPKPETQGFNYQICHNKAFKNFDAGDLN